MVNGNYQQLIELISKSSGVSVEEIERKIDNVQRELEIDILTTKLNSSTLLLKDIIERLEKTADIIISVLDQIRVLAVST